LSPTRTGATAVAESDVEELALLHFAQLGYECLHGPEIAPEEPASERATYADVVLRGRLEESLHRLNPEVPPAAVAEALRRVLVPDSPSLLQNVHVNKRLNTIDEPLLETVRPNDLGCQHVLAGFLAGQRIHIERLKGSAETH
jgi:hypothetical protein